MRSKVRERVIDDIKVGIIGLDEELCDISFSRNNKILVRCCREGFEELLGITIEDLQGAHPVKAVIEILKDFGISKPSQDLIDSCRKKWKW